MTIYGIILIIICVIDLAGTSLGLHFAPGDFTEFNPVMNYFVIRWGIPGLIFGKILLTAPLIAAIEIFYKKCEYARRRLPLYYGTGIGVYVAALSAAVYIQW